MADLVKSPGGGMNGGINIEKLLASSGDQATPSGSDSGDDTFPDGRSSDVRLNKDGAPLLSSPVSPNNLNFANLNINTGSPRSQKEIGSRYSHPHQRGVHANNNTNTSSSPPRDFRRDLNNRQAPSYNARATGGSFRNSRTWMSADAQAQQEFMVIRNSMRRVFKHSEIAKWKLSDYIAHREAMLASQANKLASRVKVKEEARGSPTIPIETQATMRKCGLEGNFDEHGNFGRVLGEQTIWCKDWLDGKEEISPWPSMAEMKWEGDDRAKTGVGRFLPLPREEGPPSLQWNQLPAIEQYPMDQVCKIPTMEDVYLPIDADIEPDKEYLWSRDLEKDMDDLLES